LVGFNIDGTNYYDGTLEINDKITATPNSNPTLIINGSLEFNALGKTIDPGIEFIVKDDVKIKQQTEIGANVSFFAGKDIILNQHIKTDTGIFLVSGGSITIGQSSEFRGILYAQEDITIKQHVSFRGCIVGTADINIKPGVNVRYDPTVFLRDLPDWLLETENVVKKAKSWQEVASP
jgi:hypothetical protein